MPPFDRRHVDLAQALLVVNRGEAADRASRQELAMGELLRRMALIKDASAPGIADLVVAISEQRAMAFHESDLALELVRTPEVVAVEKRDIASARELDAEIARVRGTAP